MATRLLDDNDIVATNVDASYTVEWLVYIVNSLSSIELLTNGKGHILPPLTIITEASNENREILFTCNLTLKGLNKALFIHWGDQTFGEAKQVEFNHQIPLLVSIEIEFYNKDFIIIHPKSEKQLMEIYSELQNNPEYSGRMLSLKVLMVDKILNEDVANELEVNKGGHRELNQGLQQVLNILSVNVSTIGNLSFIDSIAITDDFLSLVEPSEPSELPFYMLRRILLHQHNYKELSSKCVILTKPSKKYRSLLDIMDMLDREEENETLHSMDIFLLLFFQCNVLYRQIFVENVVLCQSSLPLITMDPVKNNLMMYDFALGNIKKNCVIGGRVEEFRIVRKPMPIISFIRLESAGRSHSKSKMINQLLGVSHNYFFHREIRGSSTKSHLLPGTIEVGWYLPKKKGINQFNQHITILNLRGNSIIFPKQVSFLQVVSHLIFIYVSLDRMSEQEWLFLNELFSIHGSKCALLIEEKPTNPKYIIKDLKNLKKDKKNWILLTENFSSRDKIVETINYYTQESPAIYSIENCTEIAKELGIILESESVKNISVFPKVVENLFTPYIKNSTSQLALSKIKNDILKLQGRWWKEWSNGRRNMNKIHISNEGIVSNVAKFKGDMQESRINQVKYLYSMETPILQLLVTYLTNDLDSMDSSLLFFRILKIFLEDLALYVLPNLLQEFKINAEILHQDRSQDCGSPSIEDRLLEIENEISNSSIGEEHIMREFAQIFESTTTVDKSYNDTIRDKCVIEQYDVKNLPTMAARFLLSGLPLEILDGDVSQIPITWIKSIFQEIGKIIGVNKKVYIVSILGIQSSGKSTLLNTMFGLQFPVSAGRCTKGAFMQLVPVDEEASEFLGYDYLMVVDTEGLKGMERRNNSSHLHDNELATFAIGLANLTVININGEDQSDMHDILQITIFALIRMKKVELNPKCIFIHQNVVSDNADEKLITQRNNLVTLLNEMTLAAASQEDLTLKYSRFSDVIGFDPKSDVLYFSGLLQGEPPMAPINLGYCLDAEEARSTILMKFIKSGQFYKLHEVGKRIDEIWSCIMREDFAFHFRNVLELNVTLELEMELAKWESTYTKDLREWECQQLNKFSNLSGECLETYWIALSNILIGKCESLCENQQQELIAKFFENHKSKDILKNRQHHIEEYFKVIRLKQFSNIYKNFERIYNNYLHNKDLDKLLNDVENKLLQDIMELYKVHRNQAEQGQLNDETIAEIFLQKWNELSKGFPTETNKPVDIKQLLQIFFQSTEILRSINFTDKTLLIGEVNKFNEIGSVSEFPIIKGFHYTKIRNNITNEETSKKYDKTQNIRVFLADLQNKCQTLIDSKFNNESNFSENAFKWILDLVDNQFNIRNKENISINRRELNYKLTKNLVHDFAFYQCSILMPKFENIQKTFLEKNSIKNKVEKKKKQFKTYFLSLWKVVQDEQCAANELATLIFNSIVTSAHQVMEREIITVFKQHNNQYRTKYELQINVLIELCEKECFHSLMQYIQDPVEYIKMRFQQQVHSFYTKDEMRKIIFESYNKHVTNLIDIIFNAAKKALEIFSKDNITYEQVISVTPKDTWKRIFIELIKDDIPNISTTKLAIFNAYDIKDYSAFIQAFIDSLSEKQKENHVEMPGEYNSFCEEILKTIIQCDSICPYCKELCQRNLAGHEHYCGGYHKPLGLLGIKNNSNELITEPCPSLIRKTGILSKRSRLANLNLSEERIKTTNWRINEKEAIVTHYWIWVMNKFHLNFEEYFEATLNIPEHTLFTKDEILSELREKLDSVGNLNHIPEESINRPKFLQMLHDIYFFLFH